MNKAEVWEQDSEDKAKPQISQPLIQWAEQSLFFSTGELMNLTSALKAYVAF